MATYLERLFININVIPYSCLLSLAEKDEFLEEEHMAKAFLFLEGHQEFILTDQRPLFLQIDLEQEREPRKLIYLTKWSFACLVSSPSHLNHRHSHHSLGYLP